MRILIALLVAAIAGQAMGGETLIPEAQAVVARGLLDPASAQFRDMKEVAGLGVCGQVNAKNSFGGYAGYRAFVWIKPMGLLRYDEVDGRYEEAVIAAYAFYLIGCPAEMRVYVNKRDLTWLNKKLINAGGEPVVIPEGIPEKW